MYEDHHGSQPMGNENPRTLQTKNSINTVSTETAVLTTVQINLINQM